MDNSEGGLLTKGLDAGGALKDGVGDVGPLKQGAEEQTTNTSSYNKHIGFSFSRHFFSCVRKIRGEKLKVVKVQMRDEE